MKTLESCSPSWQRRRFICPRCKLYSWPHGAKCILTGVILGIWSWSHSTNHTARHKDCCCFAPVIGGCEPTNGPRRRRPVSSFPASMIVFSLTFHSSRRYGGEEASKMTFQSSLIPLTCSLLVHRSWPAYLGMKGMKSTGAQRTSAPTLACNCASAC